MVYGMIRRPWIWAVLAFVVVCSVFLVQASQAYMADHPSGRLIVTGRAELKVEPDMAIFHVGVETRGETVEEAREANAASMQRVQSRLLSAGIDPKALRSRGYHVYPEWQYDRETGNQTLVGYRVTHTLEVTVYELDSLGALLDAAMEEGANQVSGPTFGLRNAEALEAEALKEAVRRARAKAEVLAAASGAFLKGIVEIREDVSVPIGSVARTAALAFDAMEKTTTSISPGEVSVTATVTITFAI